MSNKENSRIWQSITTLSYSRRMSVQYVGATSEATFRCWMKTSDGNLRRGVRQMNYGEPLGGIGPLKAPGLDGFPASFFQKTWGVTRPALVCFVKQVLEKREMPSEINESLMVLIPKEDKLASIKGFRPINLCNVCIKLVTKILINRLKEVFGSRISPTQGALVPGRQGVDNTVVCQEIVHLL